jgi:hypothetical protein
LPTYAGVIDRYATILQAGELPLIWMLIWGAKDQPEVTANPAPAT